MLKITQKVKPVVLCILDGWGIAADSEGNAVTRANPINFNGLWFSYPHTYLTTYGRWVGLPEGEVGNSEVGHENLGAGRIVFQDQLRIDLAIENGSFFENEALLEAINFQNSKNSDIHLIGLIGTGTVHSKISHLFALLALLQKAQVPQDKIKLHLITDGRDSPPTSAKSLISQITAKISREKLAQVATISGRFFAMDRDNRWDRTQKAYMALTGQSARTGNNSVKIIDDSYAAGVTDEFIEPKVFTDESGQPLGKIKENDVVIFFNFRPDRIRQIVKALVRQNLKGIKTESGEEAKTFDRGEKISGLFTVTMTSYEKGLDVTKVAFAPEEVPMPLARVISERNLRQFHIAETEKYAHVTYFFNGGREAPFPGEDRLLVNSPKVKTYVEKPQMAAGEITKNLQMRIRDRNYDFVVVNFANADMLGHTGNFEAAVKGIQAVDTYLGVISKTVLSGGGALLITADHGNAEQMINPQTQQIDTEHQASPAPLIITAAEFRGKNIQVKAGILADVAPTILAMMNIPKPSQITGRNLLE